LWFTIPLESKNASNMTFVLLHTWHPFFGHGDVGPFHRDDCCFVSGSYPYTQDSSPVTMFLRNCTSSHELEANALFTTFTRHKNRYDINARVTSATFHIQLSKRSHLQLVSRVAKIRTNMSRLVANTSHPANNHYNSNPDTIRTNLVSLPPTTRKITIDSLRQSAETHLNQDA